MECFKGPFGFTHFDVDNLSGIRCLDGMSGEVTNDSDRVKVLCKVPGKPSGFENFLDLDVEAAFADAFLSSDQVL